MFSFNNNNNNDKKVIFDNHLHVILNCVYQKTTHAIRSSHFEIKANLKCSCIKQ